MKHLFALLLLLPLIFDASAQSDVEMYIQQFNRVAVEEMHKFGIPASITLAQGILESGSGKSMLALKSNNHFGIKCHTGWAGKKTFHDDDKKNECFRVYADVSESFRDHSLFLVHRNRYSFLFDLDRTDYKEWAKGLKKAGYATNPRYAHLLIDLIERYDLHAYDLISDLEMLADKEDHNSVKEVKKVEEQLMTTGTPEVDQNIDILSNSSEKVFLFNRIKTVIAGPNDNLISISQKHNIKLKRLKKYNELYDDEDIKPGMHIYLQPKRSRGAYKYYVVKPGESMRDIAQKNGMKVSELYEKNHMVANDQPEASELLYLRKENDNTPATITYEEFLKRKNDKLKQQLRQKEEVAITSPEIETNDVISNDSVDEVVETKTKAVDEEFQVTTLEPRTATTQDELEEKSDAVSEMTYTVQKGDTLYSIARWFKTSVSEIKSWNNLNTDALSIGQVLIVGK